MAIKRSQDFLYFQNKAHHYHNIQSARSSVQDRSHLTPSYTITHPNPNRGLTHLRNHQIQFQNRNLTNRLIAISTTPTYSVVSNGIYSRYNKFQRQFRKQIPKQKIQSQRKMRIQNQKQQRYLSTIKPCIGNTIQWQSQYRRKDKYKRLGSKYQQGRQSGVLIQNQPYLLDPYKRFIDHLSNSGSASKLKESGASRKCVKIYQEQLFQLPVFGRNQKGEKNQFIKERSGGQKYNVVEKVDGKEEGREIGSQDE